MRRGTLAFVGALVVVLLLGGVRLYRIRAAETERDKTQAAFAGAPESEAAEPRLATAGDEVKTPRAQAEGAGAGGGAGQRISAAEELWQEIPAGALRESLLRLDAAARRRALEKLARLHVPKEDYASLRAAANGGLFYACVFPRPPDETGTRNAMGQGSGGALAGAAGASVPIATPPVFHSKPGSANVLYLDFNGHTITGTAWNTSNGAAAVYQALPYDTDGDATSFSDAEQAVIAQVWQRVAEDYAPFDVDVTTEEPAVFTSTTGRAVITKNVDANGVGMPSGTAGGVAWLDVFGEADYATASSPVLIYYNNLGNTRADYIAEATAHEFGHNLSLSHDGQTNGNEYYGGHGSGETSWGPIMGTGYNRNVSQWSKGEYYLANNTEDDLAIISGHLGYRADEAGGTVATAAVAAVNGTVVSASGILSSASDSDTFAVSTGAGTLTLSASPYRAASNTYGGDADLKLEVLNAAGTVVASADPSATTTVSLSYAAAAGTYFVRLTPSSTGTPLASTPTGYTSYASIGHYTLTGTIVPAAPQILGPLTASTPAGANFSYAIAATNSPTSYTAAGLPTGLTCDAGSGVISGRAAVAGVFAVALTATNGVGSAQATLTLTITDAAPAITSQTGGRTTVPAGGVLTLQVAAISANGAASYQWKHNGLAVAGGTNSTLTVPSASVAGSGYFQAVVTNAIGSTTSAAMFVRVAPAVAEVLTWGKNDHGQLNEPVALEDATEVVAGTYHVLALKSDGTVAAWGDDSKGQTDVPADLSDVVEVAAGKYHSLALLANGTVRGWGLGTSGQTTAPDGLSDVVEISAGDYYSVALKADGSVVAWGDNAYGQRNVPGGLSGVIGVAAGAAHVLALKGDGTVTAWGWNANGQASVPGSLAGVVAVAAGTNHSVALNSNGTVTAWGASTFTSGASALTGVTAIAAGNNHSLALKADGTVSGWGTDTDGQIAGGAGVTTVVGVDAGLSFSVALRDATGDVAPTFTAQPVDRAIISGGSATFSVATNASTASYGWEVDSGSGWEVVAEGAPFSGAATTTLSIADVTTVMNGWQFRCVATNAAGSTTSSVATLTVAKAAQTIAFEAVSAKTFGDAAFAVKATATSGLPVDVSVVSGPATMANGVVTLTGAGTVTLRASQAGDARYAAATDVNVSFTVEKAVPLLTWAAPAGIVYGTALSETQLNATASVPGVFVYSPAAGTVLDAGSGAVLSVTFTPAETENYTRATATTTIAVAAATQTISYAPVGAKTFGDAPFIVAASASSGLPVTIVVAAGPASVANGAVTLSGAGAVTLVLRQAGNANFAAAPDVPVMFSVAKDQPLLAWEAPAAIAYGTVLSSAQLNATADVAGTFVYDPPAGTVLAAGEAQVLSVTFTPDDAADFTKATATTTITVAPAAQTIAVDPITAKTFGDAAFAVTATATSGLPVDVSVVSGPATMANGVVTLTGAGAVSLRASQAGDPNFKAADDVVVSFTVAKAGPVLTWSAPAAIAYGTVFSSAQLNATADVAGTFVYDPPAGTVLAAGEAQVLSVTFTPDDAANFTEATATTTITVAPAAQTIAIDPITAKTFGDAAFAVTATATSGLPVSVSVVSGPATMANGVVTLTGAGAVSLRASQVGDANFTAADDVVVSFTVAKAGPVLMWSAPAAIAYGTALSTAQLNATADVAGTFVYDPPAGTVLAAGEAQVLRATFTPDDAANFAEATATTTITVAPAAQTIEVEPIAAKTFGDAAFAVTATATSGLPVSVSVVSGPATMANGVVTLTGAGTVTLRASQAGDARYVAATDVDVSFTVAKAVPVLTWSAPAAIAYGEALSATQLNATASVPGAFAYVPALGTTLGAGDGQVLSVTFTPDDAADFTEATATTTITVAPAAQTIAVDPITAKTFGDAAFAVTATATSGLPVSVSVVSGPATMANGVVTLTGAGAVSLRASQAGDARYVAATDVDVSFTVAKAVPVLTWSAPAAIAYGEALSATQLNATASVPGAFAYVPALGTTLGAGDGQVLSVTFTPDDAADFTEATATTTITVAPAAQTIAIDPITAKTFGDAAFAVTATATSGLPVDVSVVSGPATMANGVVTLTGAGTVTLRASQGGDANFTAAEDVVVSFTVAKAVPVLTWSAPAAIAYGTALSSTQLNATASVPGTFVYDPAAGTKLEAGDAQVLRAMFTPEDSANYVSASLTREIDVKLIATQIITQPVSVVVVEGENAIFRVVATGAPEPTFQWQKDGTPLTGATSATLVLAAVSADDAGAFTVTVANSARTVVSQEATLTVNPIAPVISATDLSAVQGQSFDFQINANTTSATYGASGLPAGLTVNTATGAISGTPTTTGSFTVTLSASNATSSDSKQITLTVQPPAPVITSPGATGGRVGSAFTYTIVASNGATTYSAPYLPDGLTLNAATGEITGTPTTAGTYLVVITASNVTGSATTQLQITVESAANAPLYAGATSFSAVQNTGFALVPAFTNSPTGFALAKLADGTDSVLPTGLTFNATTGVLTGTPTQVGVFTFALRATNAGGSSTVTLTLTVNPAPAAPKITSASSAMATVGVAFSFQLTASATPAATSFTLVSGTLPAGLTLNPASGLISGTPGAPALTTVSVAATNTVGTGAAAQLVFSVSPSPTAPAITSALVATGQVGTALSYQLTASNTPTSFTLVSGTLPAGLAFDGATGAISGTPTTVGQRRVYFAASNASGRGLALEVLFSITAAPTVPVVTSNPTAEGQVGQAFLYIVTGTNTPISYGVTGTLPAGLVAEEGVIYGVPAQSGTAILTLTATNADGTGAAKTLTITIRPAPATPVITSALNASGRVGTAFAYQATATENATSFVALGLPSGLTMNSAGQISGTPTAAGTFGVTLRATNAAGAGTPAILSLAINAAAQAPKLTSAAAQAGKVRVPFTYQASAAPGPITSYGLTGTLPLGLAFNTSTGLLSGTPAESGVFVVTLTATADAGTSLGQDVALFISPADDVPVINSSTRADGTVDAAFSFTVTATNLPAAPFPPYATIDAIGLPDGLAINPSTGLIQGTPTSAGTFTVYLAATNLNGTGPVRTLTLVIKPSPSAPIINSSPQAAAQAGVAFSYQIGALNGATAYEVIGAPAWLGVNATTGALTGTPTLPGTVTVQLLASNATGTSSPQTLTLTIAPAANTPVITSGQAATGAIGAAFSYQIAATNTPTSYIATGLPEGLVFDGATGQITGTPQASGEFRVTLTAVNAQGPGAGAALVLTIVSSVQFIDAGG
ncbi:putative Ig domain-containing protein [Horticoccus luteus]|uniref:Ig domain-containing protein n=1 Tax=Horticoccus luteus TaxID=2862869 RepID=A0A8F9TVH9_9BACT|nr:putative Ig domain-containing protein [Horticoccus luteus]QYM79845.1 putative Ig domain-containing protein [Horticoccus luteus]